MARKAMMTADRAERIALELTQNPKYKDFFDFCETYLRVLNKPETSGIDGVKLVPLVLNEVQRDFAQKIIDRWEAGHPGRFIVLKARRMGFSTVVTAFSVWLLLTNKHRNGFVIAHDNKSTQNVFQMAKRMIDHLPSKGQAGSGQAARMGEDLRPATRYDNRNELWMVHPQDQTKGHNSKFDTATASDVDAGRSFEIHVLHGSEVAFWDDPDTLLGGVLQTVSKTPDTLVVLESTANGSGGYFYDEFWLHYLGKDKHGKRVDSDWVSLFYAWWRMPFYRRVLPKGLTAEEFLRDFADETLRGMHFEYGLHIEQTYWAYRCWRDDCKSSWSKFKQEYPGKPEEAFAFASSRVYGEDQVKIVEDRYRMAPVHRGAIVDESGNAEDEARARLPSWDEMEPRFSAATEGAETDDDLWIWKLPVPGRGYVIALDPASGVSAGDFSAIQVLDAVTREQVAEYHGHCETHVLGYLGVLMSIFYNRGFLTWEVNGLGRAVSTAVLQTQYPYIYMRVALERDATGDEQVPGWITTKATKPTMVMLGKQAVASAGSAPIRSGRLYSEVRSFREITKKPSRGQSGVQAGDEVHRRVIYGAALGAHDDLLMAWLQALAVLDSGMYVAGGDYSYLPTGETRTKEEVLEEEWEEYLQDFDAAPERRAGDGWQ